MLSNSQKNLLMVGVLVVAAGSVGAFFYLTAPESSDSPATNTPQSIRPITGQPPGLTPQPAGDAPPGQVWSAEHGHWHDAATGQAVQPTSPTATPTSTPGQLTPPPPGDVPEGKVWNAEHGHWHDAPAVRVINPNEAKPSDSN